MSGDRFHTITDRLPIVYNCVEFKSCVDIELIINLQYKYRFNSIINTLPKDIIKLLIRYIRLAFFNDLEIFIHSSKQFAIIMNKTMIKESALFIRYFTSMNDISNLPMYVKLLKWLETIDRNGYDALSTEIENSLLTLSQCGEILVLSCAYRIEILITPLKYILEQQYKNIVRKKVKK